MLINTITTSTKLLIGGRKSIAVFFCFECRGMCSTHAPPPVSNQQLIHLSVFLNIGNQAFAFTSWKTAIWNSQHQPSAKLILAATKNSIPSPLSSLLLAHEKQPTHSSLELGLGIYVKPEPVASLPMRSRMLNYWASISARKCGRRYICMQYLMSAP